VITAAELRPARHPPPGILVTSQAPSRAIAPIAGTENLTTWTATLVGSVVQVYVEYRPQIANHDVATVSPTHRSRRATAPASPSAPRSTSHRTMIHASAISPSTSIGMACIRCAGMIRRFGPIAPRANVTSPGWYPVVRGPP